MIKKFKKFNELQIDENQVKDNSKFDEKRKNYVRKFGGYRIIQSKRMYQQVGENVENLIEELMKIYDIDRKSALNNISLLTEYIRKEDHLKTLKM